MNKNYLLGLGLGLLGMVSLSALAEKPPLLNTVDYQMQAKSWVNTDSAKVQVQVNATVSNQSLTTAQQEVMNKLGRVSQGLAWHINHFQMKQDNAGLQTLTWQMSVRLPLKMVNTIQAQINKLSQAGQKYTLLGVDFNPSLVERQKAEAKLRQQIYQHIKQELSQLNRDFTHAHYFLHRINFSADQPAMTMARNNVSMLRLPSSSLPAASIGRELSVTASIELASTKIHNV